MKAFIFTLLFPLVSAAKITVAVVDSGLKKNIKSEKICNVKNFTKEAVDAYADHGTNVVGIILKEAPADLDYCINFYKAFSSTGYSANKNYLMALEQVAKDKPDILNISAGGSTIWDEEARLIKKILDNGTIIVAAAGNNATNLTKNCDYYPACLDKRIIVVGNGFNGSYYRSSNYGKVVDVIADGQNQTAFEITLSGTSQSTAKITAFMLRLRKWVAK